MKRKEREKLYLDDSVSDMCHVTLSNFMIFIFPHILFGTTMFHLVIRIILIGYKLNRQRPELKKKKKNYTWQVCCIIKPQERLTMNISGLDSICNYPNISSGQGL